MLNELTSFLYGLIYGFSLAVPPGPMNALIAARSIKSFRDGFLTGFGALSADFSFMIITFYAYNIVENIDLRPFYLTGSLYMYFLIYTIYRSSITKSYNKNIMISDEKYKGILFSYLSGLLMGLTNPYQILWWLTAGLSFISLFGLTSIIGLFTAIFVWIILFPSMIRTGYKLDNVKTIIMVKLFSIITLLFFASYLLYSFFLSLITTMV